MQMESVNIFRGSVGKVLIHEWTHLRYGVFDEFGLYDDERFYAFYMDGDLVRVTSCANSVLEGRIT